MKIAVIGSGISGISAAEKLHSLDHQVILFEANEIIGGHVRTKHVPFPVDLGVFMHDPIHIHPMMGKKIRELGLKTREISLTFSFENPSTHIKLTSKSRFSGVLKDYLTALSVIGSSLISGNSWRHVCYLKELNRFFSMMPSICAAEEWQGKSVQEFIEKKSFSEDFMENWFFPQLMCWWGATKKHALKSSIQVIVESMYLVYISPQYIFEEGWDQFTDAIAAPIKNQIRTGARVNSVNRKEGVIEVEVNGEVEEFDQVVFATPPNVVSEVLQNLTPQEREVLQQFETITTTVYLHQDSRWLPRRNNNETINLVQDERGSFCTLNFGSLLPKNPMLLVTWGDDLKDVPQKVITKADWLRTLPTVAYAKACCEIDIIQGEGGVWHCGAHVHALDQGKIPSLWHENAYRSGLSVAEKIIQKDLINDERSRLSGIR